MNDISDERRHVVHVGVDTNGLGEVDTHATVEDVQHHRKLKYPDNLGEPPVFVSMNDELPVVLIISSSDEMISSVSTR
jgi:hypothetical protein